jgi:hypothetical protein
LLKPTLLLTLPMEPCQYTSIRTNPSSMKTSGDKTSEARRQRQTKRHQDGIEAGVLLFETTPPSPAKRHRHDTKPNEGNLATPNERQKSSSLRSTASIRWPEEERNKDWIRGGGWGLLC